MIISEVGEWVPEKHARVQRYIEIAAGARANYIHLWLHWWPKSGELAFPNELCNIRHMNQALLIEVLRTFDAALRENGATRLFIFGSRATGIPRSDSDLDLFIDYDPVTKVPNIISRHANRG